MSETEQFPEGTLVRYHGSVDYAHGYYVVTGTHEPYNGADPYPGGVAYALDPADETGEKVPISPLRNRGGRTDLYNVRSSSFTKTDPKVANPKRTKVK